MPDLVCVDASLVLADLLHEPERPQVLRLRNEWEENGRKMIAPPLFWVEVSSTIRRHVHAHKITPAAGEAAFNRWQSDWPVSVQLPAELTVRAWNLAILTDQPRVYDAQYLGLAHLAGCELWTADKRLYNGTHRLLPFVHWIGELAP